MKDLIVALADKQVVFPDGVPHCLACGGEAAGTRRVTFEPVDDFVMPTHAGKLLSHLQALRRRVAFDAPLCGPHLRRAKALSWKAPLYGLSALSLVSGAVVVLLGTSLAEQSKAAWLLLLPGVIAILITYATWISKDRGGLPCQAVLLEDGGVLLKYPDSDPSGE